MYPVLRQVCSFLQSKLSTECNLVRHLSSSSIFSLLFSSRLSSTSLCLLPRLPTPSIIPSLAYFRRQFLYNMWPIQSVLHHCILCRMFLSSFTVCNIPSFSTCWVQRVSILLQHHMSKLSRGFLSTILSVQVSASYRAMLQMYNVLILEL